MAKKTKMVGVEASQDSVTDALLSVYEKSGINGVKSFLRMAVSNFAVECKGGRNSMSAPDERILSELADAIQTPAHLQ